MCADGIVAVLSMADQRSCREKAQTNHLCSDGTELRAMLGRCARLYIPMLVSQVRAHVTSTTLTALRPIRAAWTWEIKDDARCLNEGVSITTIGALLSVLDFIVNILPLPIVARLNVAFKQRIAATVLLSLGTIATAAGVVREVYVYRAFIGTKDSTWGALPLWICADVEIYVGLVCSTAPDYPSKPTNTDIEPIALCLCSLPSSPMA